MTHLNETAEQYSNELVMIVDDSTIDTFINKRIMAFYKFAKETITYTSSERALEQLAIMYLTIDISGPIPSYLFLDLNMPLIDGFEFLKRYNELSPRFRSMCKVVILSNSMSPMDLSQAVNNHNVFSYLTKPLIKSNLQELAGISMNLKYVPVKR